MEINLDDTVSGIVEKITKQAISRGTRAANELRNASLQVLRGQRSGRIYRRPHSSGTYTASAPGEPPANRSGVLRLSWKSQAKSSKSGKTVSIRPAIWTDVKYAPTLQEGTKKMAPRPFEEPIVEQAKDKIITNEEINRVQIIFDDTPDEATRAKLKSHGFRWAPSERAWQMQRTPAALARAKWLLGITEEGGN